MLGWLQVVLFTGLGENSHQSCSIPYVQCLWCWQQCYLRMPVITIIVLNNEQVTRSSTTHKLLIGQDLF